MTAFAERMRERYPEGLTGIFAVGGTRTTYILEHRDEPNPGGIEDFEAYATYGFNRLFEMIDMFFDLGGQNLIISLFSYQGFYERGAEYAEQASRMCLEVIEKARLDFYRSRAIDPYLVGIDTLLHLPDDHYAHDLGVQFEQFNKAWDYQEGRRKLIWEVAPIPLYSLWRAPKVMGDAAEAALAAQLETCTDLKVMHDLLYEYYARAVYGTAVPMPHFYLGSNRNGDMKLRALLPITLVCGGPFRLFYTPYPSLFVTRDTLQAILEDLAFGKPLRSTTLDYHGQVTTEMLTTEYERVQALSARTDSTLGLVRQAQAPRSV